MRIKVSTEILMKQSEDMRASLHTYTSIYHELSRCVKRITAAWEGEASCLAAQQMERWKQAMNICIRNLTLYPDLMARIAQRYQSAEITDLALSQALPSSAF